MIGLPPLCTEADCNVKANPPTAEIADSVNMIGIVTNAFSGNTVCALVLLLLLLLLQCSDFTVSLSQAVVLSFFLSLTEAHYSLIFLQTLTALCILN